MSAPLASGLEHVEIKSAALSPSAVAQVNYTHFS